MSCRVWLLARRAYRLYLHTLPASFLRGRSLLTNVKSSCDSAASAATPFPGFGLAISSSEVEPVVSVRAETELRRAPRDRESGYPQHLHGDVSLEPAEVKLHRREDWPGFAPQGQPRHGEYADRRERGYSAAAGTPGIPVESAASFVRR